MNNSQDQSMMDFSILVASSVHDLKNSISLMLLTLDDIVSNSLVRDTAEQKKLLKLGVEAHRINHDLIQLLSLYKLEQKNSIRIDEIFVSDLLNESCARNESQFAYENIKVTIDCDMDLRWYLDAELLSIALNNILVNALAHAKSRIWISAKTIDEYLQIVIDDDGDGLPDDVLAGRSSARGSVYSTGLGLTLSRLMLSMHQKDDRRGQLQLGNAGVGTGARIRLLIP